MAAQANQGHHRPSNRFVLISRDHDTNTTALTDTAMVLSDGHRHIVLFPSLSTTNSLLRTIVRRYYTIQQWYR